MPRATWIQSNFNGGEWSPLAYGRFDLAKHKNGLAECLNYMPTQQGGLARRPGTRFVAYVKDAAYAPRLQRFEFSVEQAYVLELGDGYIRFFANDGQLLTGTVAAYDNAVAYAIGALAAYGGVSYYCIATTTGHAPPDATYWYPLVGDVFEIPSPYSWDEVWALNFTQSADTLYIVHPDKPPMKLQRAGAVKWTLSTVPFLDGPYLSVNTTTTTLLPSGTSGTVTVTASSAAGINNGVGFTSNDVGRALRIKCGGVWLWGTIASRASATSITWTISPASGHQLPTTATATANISGGSVFGCTIVDGGSGYGASPPSVSFSGGSGSGAVAYAVVNNGVVTTIVISVTGTGYTSAPTVTLSAPTAIVPSTTTFWRLGVWCPQNGYPKATVFHQDRLMFAGCAQYPTRIDGSNSGDYENFAPTGPDSTVVDSNALAFALNSNTVNAITWMVSDEWGLQVGTYGGEWVVAPSGSQAALTPSNVNAKNLSTFGSSTLQPIRIGKSTLFIQRTGRKMRELIYEFVYNTFRAADISLVGEHLTRTGLKQQALQLAPQQIDWIARNDGKLVAVTYDKDQDVCGWHQHSLGGSSSADGKSEPIVESVAGIPHPSIQRDELWMVVNRWVDGARVRTVEVMAKMWEDGDSTPYCVFLDCGAGGTYVSPTTTVSGLSWLVGQTVGVLADGAVHPDCVVSEAGTINLNYAATVVQVGLRFKSRGRTLNIEAGGGDGPSQGKIKRVFRSVFRFFQSVGLTVGSDAEGVSAYPEPFRTGEDLMDSGVGLFNGDKRWSYEGSWGTDGSIFWEIDDPLPSNITMIMVQMTTEDSQ